jgi:hypothetical protein
MTDNASRPAANLFTWHRYRGLIVGGLCAGPIGLVAGSSSGDLFEAVPGSFSATSEARFSAFTQAAGTVGAILLIWGLVYARRFADTTGRKLGILIGWAALVVTLYTLVQATPSFGGSISAWQVLLVVFALLAIMSITGVTFALVFGTIALLLAQAMRLTGMPWLILSGAIVSAVPGFMGLLTDVVFGVHARSMPISLGFWMAAGIMTMGCYAFTSTPPVQNKPQT